MSIWKVIVNSNYDALVKVQKKHIMNTKHYLITCFNLRGFWEAKEREEKEIIEWIEWTKQRIKIFRQFCIPSVLNQSNKSFKWLVFVDMDTPQLLKQEIKSLITYDFTDVIYLSGYNDFEKNYTKYISRNFTPKDKWVITTNLDNDDCLHRNAIKSIQENFVAKDNFLISLSRGYTLNLKDLTLSEYYYPTGPFISLVESTKKIIVGVRQKPHNEWLNLRKNTLEQFLDLFKSNEKKTAAFISSGPMWIQVIHGENVTNNFYRGLPVLNNISLTEFGVDITTKKMPLGSIRNYVNYVMWKRYLRGFIATKFKKLWTSHKSV